MGDKDVYGSSEEQEGNSTMGLASHEGGGLTYGLTIQSKCTSHALRYALAKDLAEPSDSY